jgi:hypothetical protein
MEKISIICLIYQSEEYAEFFYNNLVTHTPELKSGEAEFLFVANDATSNLLYFLKELCYPHVINNNPKYTEDELFKKGYAFPEYMSRVYMGYNFGMRYSQNPILMLVSSDNCFSSGWLQNLRKRLTPSNVVSPRLIQPKIPFPNPINHSECEVYDFGQGIDTFDEQAFLEKAKEISVDNESIGNAFMPLMIYKNNAESVGYYPEGNLHRGSYEWINRTGDTEFYLRLAEKGIRHITSDDSIVYHFNEGEKYLKKE